MVKTIHPYLNLFFLAVCIALVAYSATKLYSYYRHEKKAIKTMGVFLEYTTKTGYAKLTKNRKPVHAPSFTFTAKQGDELTIQSKDFFQEKKYSKGDMVEILYLEENPKDAYIEGSYPYKNNVYLLIGSFIGFIITVMPIMRRLF